MDRPRDLVSYIEYTGPVLFFWLNYFCFGKNLGWILLNCSIAVLSVI